MTSKQAKRLTKADGIRHAREYAQGITHGHPTPVQVSGNREYLAGWLEASK